MDCIETKNGVKLRGVSDLNLGETLDCGQSFRWRRLADGSFDGAAFGRYVNVRLDGGELYINNSSKEDFENIWFDYFDFSTDYGRIREELSKIHPVLAEAAKYAPGIRILRQEPYEALCTFIISQNNNIKRIKGIVARLCENFGDKITESEFAFPAVETMARLGEEELSLLRAGFRSRYLADAAKKVASGEVDFEKCRRSDYETAKSELMKIVGVGGKVADCTLLFGFHRLEAFPIDVWMRRAMDRLFPNMTAADFGEYAGIAQQYIFHYSRMHPELFG